MCWNCYQSPTSSNFDRQLVRRAAQVPARNQLFLSFNVALSIHFGSRQVSFFFHSTFVCRFLTIVCITFMSRISQTGQHGCPFAVPARGQHYRSAQRSGVSYSYYYIFGRSEYVVIFSSRNITRGLQGLDLYVLPD